MMLSFLYLLLHNFLNGTLVENTLRDCQFTSSLALIHCCGKSLLCMAYWTILDARKCYTNLFMSWLCLHVESDLDIGWFVASIYCGYWEYYQSLEGGEEEGRSGGWADVKDKTLQHHANHSHFLFVFLN